MPFRKPTHTEFTVLADDGVRLRARVTGKGFPLVLSGGVSCESSIWHRFEAEFRRSCSVITWDYRGHGLSEVPSDLSSLTVSRHAADLRNVLSAIGVPAAVHVGFGMGVQVILEFVRQYPFEVEGLIPICGSFKNPLETFLNLSIPRTTVDQGLKITESLGDSLSWVWRQAIGYHWMQRSIRFLAANPRLVAPEDLQGCFLGLPRTNPGILLYTLKGLVNHDASAVLEGISVPALIVAGELDRFTPLFLAEEMNARIPHAELFVVRKGSHLAFLDAPEVVHLRVEKFLRENFGLKFLPPPHPKNQQHV